MRLDKVTHYVKRAEKKQTKESETAPDTSVRRSTKRSRYFTATYIYMQRAYGRLSGFQMNLSKTRVSLFYGFSFAGLELSDSLLSSVGFPRSA